jgi:hypothetical protein
MILVELLRGRWVLGEAWYLWSRAPIVSHHLWNFEGTWPSGWKTYVVLPYDK